MRKNRLKQLWREGKPAFGMWSDLGSPAVVEAMAQLELDWILLDGEHGVASFEACYGLLQAMNGSQASSIIRVPWNERIGIKRALDMGAEGILVPYIKSAAEAREIVSACRYPPVGTRGLGPYRASKYEYDFMDYYKRANEEIAVIVQIETAEALAEIEAIAATPGLDALFIGPADLSATLGHFPDMAHPEMQKAYAKILETGTKAGLPVGYYCNTGKDALARAAQGYRMMNVGNDMALATHALLKEVNAVRKGDAGGEGPKSYS